MKLVINIPCFNEEETLPLVLKDIPKKIPGIKKIEIQIVDDGSSDNTAAVAEKHGCRVIRHKKNLGLGIAFKHGVQTALANGADIMVNTDADNQYPSRFIGELCRPVVDGTADVVIGNRQTWKIRHFSPVKKFFQWFGSLMVRKLTGSDVRDTVSGFRAYSRESLLRLNVQTRFSYVLDTIMQCSVKNLKMASVDIETNRPTRKSRLFKNMLQHMIKSGGNLINIYIIYMPFMTFLTIAVLLFIPSFLIMGRFVYFFIQDGGFGHVQSLIASAMLFLSGVLFLVLGIIANLIKVNRQLVEETLYLQKKTYYGFR
ncbi:MAG: glycosyltransferase family 2 protein [Spirochaetota bacterium]